MGISESTTVFNHDDATGETPKQNLGDRDLTPLFSGMTNVQVKNQKVGGLGDIENSNRRGGR